MKPLNVSVTKNSPKGIEIDLEKSVTNQLFILISTLSDSNWENHYRQTEFIVAHKESLYYQVHYKCLSLLKLEYSQLVPKDVLPLEKFYSKFLNPTRLDSIDKYLQSLFSHISVLEFGQKLQLPAPFVVLLLGKFYYTDKKHIELEATLQLIKSFKLYIDFFHTKENTDVFIHHTLLNKYFHIAGKLLIIKFFNIYLDSSILDHKLIFEPMSLKESLLQLTNDFTPNDVLPMLLNLNSSEIVQNLALIVAELLIPGSQKLPPFLFASGKSLPESTAKGSQFKVILENVDKSFSFSWYVVFTKVQEEYLFESGQRNIQPDMVSLNLFLTAIDFNGLLDIFLNYDWYFSRELVLCFNTLDVKDGAYDFASSINLTRCFDDDSETALETQLGKRHILSFINVGKLELHVMNQINSLNSRDPKSFEILQIFEHQCHTFPEYLLLACLATADKVPFILSMIDRFLGTLFDKDGKFLRYIINKFRELDPQLALDKLLDYYVNRKQTISTLKVIRVAIASNFLEELISKGWKKGLNVGLDLIINASCFGYNTAVIIDKIFEDVNQRPGLFQTIVDILETRASEDQQLQRQQSIEPLPLPVVYHLLILLNKNNGVIEIDRLRSLQLLLLTTYPRLINFGSGHDNAILANVKMSSNFPETIEQEMKSYYSKMYNKELEIGEIVDMLIKLKSSDIPRDQDIFACMIHSLLDEYRFFSEYPLNALASTSLLFGALLQKDIIQGTTLTVALNFIWESCNQPPDSHLFKFAVQALYNFKSRLVEYPNYCKHLLECKTLSLHPKMYQIVKDASNGIACIDQPPKTEDKSSGQPMNRKLDDDSGLKYQSLVINTQTVGLIPQEKPNESVCDKLLFSVNNLTIDNLKTKLLEIKDLLTENFFLWFSDYLVGDRAKAEPNNHQLYAELVSDFGNTILYEYILNVTVMEITGLIRNFKDTFNERNHLKNLGAWLGQITLASDKPLKRNHIGVKFLLVEAFDFNTLNFIIPFVCKVLDQAQYSKIFRPPNPWILGVFGVLVELYECGDLKLNLKFEIEVLLNSFKMKVTDIKALTLIRSHNPNPAALATLFGIQNGNIETFYQALHVPHVMPPRPQQMSLPPQAPPGVQFDTSFSTLHGNSIFTQNPNLRRAFQASLSRAVRECALPILTRTSESVLITTEALIKKDFAREGNVARFRKSYQNLALKLSQNMVACSGRKLICDTIENTMIQLLAHQISLNDLPPGELTSAIQANADQCVDIINKIASGNILELIEERMRPLVVAREQNLGNFVDNDNIGISGMLPPPLGLRAEGLTPNQMAIYENFGVLLPIGVQGIPTPNNQAGPITGPIVAAPAVPPGPIVGATAPVTAPAAPPAFVAGTGAGAIPAPDFTIEQTFALITQNCEQAIQKITDNYTRLDQLPPDHPIMQCITNILTLTQKFLLKSPELILKVAQYAVNCLFTQVHESPLSTEIFVFILDKLCDYSPTTAKDVTWWLVHSADQRKFNVPVMYALLQVQLVQSVKLDTSLAKLIHETGNPDIIKFASDLLYRVFTDVSRICSRSEFSTTLQELYSFDINEMPKDVVDTRHELIKVLEEPVSVHDDMFTQLGYVFTEWVKLLSHGDVTRLRIAFIKGLHQQEILSDGELFGMFFKASIEIAVASFTSEHEIRNRTQHETILAVDSLGLLIVDIILLFDKKETTLAMDYAKNIMSIILVALTNDHELGNWNERAYFRFFSSLLCYWNDASVLDANATGHLDVQFYGFIGDMFNSLQPIILPGFTFAWVSLISHRMFLPKLIENKGDSTAIKLLSSLLRFEALYGKDDDVNKDIITVIFKAINRIFIGLYNDYPRFLCENHIGLLAIIPSQYIQLRNMVLSSVPKHVPVSKPFDLGKVEDKSVPVINYQAEELTKTGIKRSTDNYLRIPASGIIKTVYNSFKASPKQADGFGYDVINYNVDLINAFVVYVLLHEDCNQFNPKSTQAGLFFDLINYGTIEFKFHLINALVNHLRYSNVHTHWVAGLLLYIVNSKTANDKAAVQEIIYRVVIERHLVNRPHPWGLSVLFGELVKNGMSVKNAPNEIKVVLESLTVL